MGGQFHGNTASDMVRAEAPVVVELVVMDRAQNAPAVGAFGNALGADLIGTAIELADATELAGVTTVQKLGIVNVHCWL